MSFFFVSENSHVAYQINGNEAENSMQAHSMPFYSPDTWMGSKFQNKSEEGHVKLNGKKCRTLCKSNV